MGMFRWRAQACFNVHASMTERHARHRSRVAFVGMADDRPLCFLICPIGEDGSETRRRSDDVMTYIVRPAAEECGFRSERADDSSNPGSITSRVISTVLTAPLVVADLSDHNPNVFYELALRHATRKPFVQLIQKGQKIPFDVGDIDTIAIDLHVGIVASAKEKLVKSIQTAVALRDSIVTPVGMTVDMMHAKGTKNPLERVVVDVLASVENTRIGGQLAPSPASPPPSRLRGLAAWVAANTTPSPPRRQYWVEEIRFVTTSARRQGEISEELHDLEYKLFNAENKPFKVRDQRTIDAIKAQIIEVQERLKNFQEEAEKVAKESFSTD